MYVCIIYARALLRHRLLLLLLLIKAIKRSGEHLDFFSVNTKLQPYCLLCLYRTDCSRIDVQVWQCHAGGERNLGKPKKMWSEE